MWLCQSYGFRLESTDRSVGVSPFGNPRLIARACRSARLIATYYVLRRLLVPRHPPIALCSLMFKPSVLLRGQKIGSPPSSSLARRLGEYRIAPRGLNAGLIALTKQIFSALDIVVFLPATSNRTSIHHKWKTRARIVKEPL